eukprot:1196414-Prorocentrum_minimum.AAC.5
MACEFCCRSHGAAGSSRSGALAGAVSARADVDADNQSCAARYAPPNASQRCDTLELAPTCQLAEPPELPARLLAPPAREARHRIR